MTLTPTQRRAALAALHWSQRGLAAVLQRDESTVRRWMRDGTDAPPEVDAWLARRAAAMLRDPPPGAAPGLPAAPWPQGRPRRMS